MMIRFGILCSWLGTGIAVALIGAALFLPMDFPGDRKEYVMAKLMLLAAPAIVALVLGWGMRYYLTASRDG
jgi:hypothetical protein